LAPIVARWPAWADLAGLITGDVWVDSTIARAHQPAAGTRTKGDVHHQPPAGVDQVKPADHPLG
jgi:hypothetical protein